MHHAIISHSHILFDKVYHQYYTEVFHRIYTLIRHREQTEDILQDVFLTLWENIHRFGKQHSLTTLLFMISYYKTMLHLQQSVGEQAMLYLPLTTDTNLYTEEEITTTDQEVIAKKIAAIHTVLHHLPPRKRMAFQLCRLEGKTYDEASAILNISAPTIRHYVKFSFRFIKRHISPPVKYSYK